MSITIEAYREEHENAVQAFNRRLVKATSDPDLVFYKSSAPKWLPKVEGSPLYNEYFVALEGSVVRGAYALKYERFAISGQGECTVACYHHPLSEGIVNRAYSSVGSLLLLDALGRESNLYALGMGGYDRPLAKMLKAMSWRLTLVPFYFRIVHPTRFLREMIAVRSSPWRRLLMDLAAFSGLGWAAISAAQSFKGMNAPRSVESVEVSEFPDWTEALWLAAKEEYSLTSVRDHKTLLRLYPASEKHLTKICVLRKGKPLGWVVVGERRKDAKYGSLRVGSIVDCWARPEDARAVITAATQALEKQEMDLILTNQSHKQWRQALASCGFWQAESNFVFATSKGFPQLLGSADGGEFHLNRANGDGLPRNY